MNPAQLTAIAAAAMLTLACARPSRIAGWLAALACVLAAALRLPAVGIAPMGLGIAAGLALATTLPGAGGRARILLAVALVWAVPATFSQAQSPLAAIGPLASAAAAFALVLTTVASTAHWATSASERSCRAVLAGLVALAPVTAGGALLPTGGAVELGFDGVGAWMQTAGLSFDHLLVPAWSWALWRATPEILLCVVLVAWASGSARATAVALAVAAAALLAATSGWLEPAQAWLAGQTPALHAPDRAFTAAVRPLVAGAGIDASPALLVLARLATLAALLLPRDAAAVSSEPAKAIQARRVLDGVTLTLAGLLLLTWAVIAPGLHGSYWWVDPAAMAAMAVMGSSVAVLSRSMLAPSAGGAARVGQLAAALLAVGGGDVGWRVASALLSA